MIIKLEWKIETQTCFNVYHSSQVHMQNIKFGISELQVSGVCILQVHRLCIGDSS